jgi:hypothetical protein
MIGTLALTAFLLYLITGIAIVLFTRARAAVWDERANAAPFLKRFLFYLLVSSAAILMWPLFLRSWFSDSTTSSKRNELEPQNALDALIAMMYGNPPPPKTAQLADAIKIATEDLLGNVVSEDEVIAKATALDSSAIPYATHDLALAVALSFFKQPERFDQLKTVQLDARRMLLEWINAQAINMHLAKVFEDTLYELYKA